MTNQMKLIGQRITDLREIAELSQQEVADFLNISLDTYKSYEDGVEDMPISILYELANKFDVDFTAKVPLMITMKQTMYMTSNSYYFFNNNFGIES